MRDAQNVVFIENWQAGMALDIFATSSATIAVGIAANLRLSCHGARSPGTSFVE
jgi:hypothetical protein